MIRVVHPGSWIQILTFYPSRIPVPGVKKAPDPGSATLIESLLKCTGTEQGTYCIQYLLKNVSYRIYVKCKGSATCEEGNIFSLTRNLSSRFNCIRKIFPIQITRLAKMGWTIQLRFFREEIKLPPNLKINSTRVYVCFYALIVSYLDLLFRQNRNRKLKGVRIFSG
jgi:hypothetical protein